MSTALTSEDSPSKIRTVFLLDSEARVALERLSADSGAPLSELIRRSIAQWLQKQAVSA